MQKKLTNLFAFAIFMLVVGWAVTPAQANCPHMGRTDHPHCRNQGGTGAQGGGLYDVTVLGPDVSQGDILMPFTGHDGGGRSKPVNVGFQFINLDLSFFFNKFDNRGMDCFNGAPVDDMDDSTDVTPTSMTISQEKDGSPIVQYWFTGYGDNGTTEVRYLLEMFGGTMDILDPWRPVGETTTVHLTSWEISINGNNEFACTSSGPAEFSTTIDVTEPQTTP